MKKFLLLILSVCLALSLVACGTQTGDNGEQTSAPDTSSGTQPGTDGTPDTSSGTDGTERKTPLATRTRIRTRLCSIFRMGL